VACSLDTSSFPSAFFSYAAAGSPRPMLSRHFFLPQFPWPSARRPSTAGSTQAAGQTRWRRGRRSGTASTYVVRSSLIACADTSQTLGWAGYIKVDGLTWHWLGNPGPGNASTWLATEVTPTGTILTVQAGPMRLNVTFLSPVEVRVWGSMRII
jgi:hypothetical protein